MENLNILACAVIERAVTDYVEEIYSGGHLIVDDRELERVEYGPWLEFLDVEPETFIKACKERKAERKERCIKYENNVVRI